MKIFESLIGQSHVFDTLERAVQMSEKFYNSNNEMTHAWLFTGASDFEMSNIARTFAAALNCPNEGCGICTVCQEIMSKMHPDVEILTVGKLSIKVDEVREVIYRASWMPLTVNWKIIILENVDQLTESAANALLKSIEEPNARTVWILCAKSIYQVPPTIRSRCRILNLNLENEYSIAQSLSRYFGVNHEKATHVSRISNANLDRAIYILKNEQTLLVRSQVLNLISTIRSINQAFQNANRIFQIIEKEVNLDLLNNSTKLIAEQIGKNQESNKSRSDISYKLTRVKINWVLDDIFAYYIEKMRKETNLRNSINIISNAIEVEDTNLIALNQNYLNIMTEIEYSRTALSRRLSPILCLENLLVTISKYESSE